MKKDILEIQEKVRRKNQKILKRGTYIIEFPGQENEEAVEEATMETADAVVGGEPLSDDIQALYDSIMPNKTEDKIQDSVNALLNEQTAANDDDIPLEEALKQVEDPEQAALIADIMDRFKNNVKNTVEDTVSSMFE